MQIRLTRHALIALLLVACGRQDASSPIIEPSIVEAPPTALVIPGTATPIGDLGPLAMDWSSTSPTEFLELLTSETPKLPFTILNEPTMDWFDEEQLQGLFARLNSPAPARSVLNAKSSRIPRELSTEGREAAFLLTGYREGRYPPRLGSMVMFEPDYNDIRSWWKTR